METSAKNQPDSWRLCLVGPVAGVQRKFQLRQGANSVGSLPSSQVMLPEKGVSRKHAELHVEDDAVRVSDLGSKNGTKVNGNRVATQELNLDDRLQFGPVALSLTRMKAADVELAIELSEFMSPVAEEKRPLETATLGEGECRQFGGGNTVERFVRDLAMEGTGGVGAVLALLVDALDVNAAWLVQYDGSNEPYLFSATAEFERERLEPKLKQVLQDAALRGRAAERWRLAQIGESPPLSCLVLASPAFPTLALLVDGEIRDGSPEEALARVALWLVVARRRQLSGTNVEAFPERMPDLQFQRGLVVCDSPQMASVYLQVRAALTGSFAVLLVGETGVGKEHLARVLHASSPRAGGPFVAVNCAAIPGDLLESEMFGIGSGVATGVRARKGKFEQAHGGTLFLDEISELAMEMQAKLLRVLQENEVHPVGAAEPVPFDARVVCATNSDLEQCIAEGKLRRDLYYRIAGYSVKIPPLRQRKSDLPGFIKSFLIRLAKENRKMIRGVTISALNVLMQYPWPGNVRELENELRRIVLSAPDGAVVDLSLLPERLAVFKGVEDDAELMADDEESFDLKKNTQVLERRLIRRALKETTGNRSEAAALLGISRNALAAKIKRLGIE